MDIKDKRKTNPRGIKMWCSNEYISKAVKQAQAAPLCSKEMAIARAELHYWRESQSWIIK